MQCESVSVTSDISTSRPSVLNLDGVSWLMPNTNTSYSLLPISGSILAALDTFKKIWISRKDYDENGSRVIDQKTF